METIKSNTKLGRIYWNRYRYATRTNIYEAYKRPSAEKVKADYFCRRRMAEEDGHGYRIISYNCHFFIVAWQTANGLRIETAYKSLIVK